MRTLTLLLAIGMLFTCSSCLKNSNNNGNTNNQFKATISVNGGAAYNLSVNGNSTLFVRSIQSNGDTATAAIGADNNGQVNVILTNINTKGTYTFYADGVSHQQTSCEYIQGSVYAPTDDFTTQNTTSTTGTVTVDSLSATYISGSFTSNCTDNSGKVSQITNGSFQGNF